MRIPAVLATVHVDIDADGHLAVDTDGEPHAPDVPHVRGDLSSVLDEITAELGTAVRVEIREHDGTTYSDIATPSEAGDQPQVDDTASVAAPPGLHGAGFRPGEKVAVACIVCIRTADADGRAVVQLPPALLVRPGLTMLLIGMTSAAVAEIG